LTELSSSEIKGSEKHPDVDETTGESTSQSVESLNHVNRHGWRTGRQKGGDKELSKSDNLSC
jgi:hypothetical protein